MAGEKGARLADFSLAASMQHEEMIKKYSYSATHAPRIAATFLLGHAIAYHAPQCSDQTPKVVWLINTTK